MCQSLPSHFRLICAILDFFRSFKVDFSRERKWLCTKISTTRISHAFPASVISLSGYRNIEKSRFHPTCQNYVEIGPSRSIKSGREIRVVEIFVHNHRLSCEKSTLVIHMLFLFFNTLVQNRSKTLTLAVKMRNAFSH